MSELYLIYAAGDMVGEVDIPVGETDGFFVANVTLPVGGEKEIMCFPDLKYGIVINKEIVGKLVDMMGLRDEDEEVPYNEHVYI